MATPAFGNLRTSESGGLGRTFDVASAASGFKERHSAASMLLLPYRRRGLRNDAQI